MLNDNELMATHKALIDAFPGRVVSLTVNVWGGGWRTDGTTTTDYSASAHGEDLSGNCVGTYGHENLADVLPALQEKVAKDLEDQRRQREEGGE